MWDDFIDGISGLVTFLGMCVCGWVFWGHIHISSWWIINAAAWCVATGIVGWLIAAVVLIGLYCLQFIPEVVGWCNVRIGRVFCRLWKGLCDL